MPPIERSIITNSWIVVDELNDAFDCDICPAMVKRPYNYCPRCGDKKIFIDNYYGTINLNLYRAIFFPDMENQ